MALINVNGTPANDTITPENINSPDIVYGLDGNDTIYYATSLVDNDLIGGNGNDVITGGTGSDILQGDAGADTLNGGAGSDTLLGGADIDALNGGADDDNLDGGAGDDTLTGGTGADWFTVSEGTDTITDLGNGADILFVKSGATATVTVGAAFTADDQTRNNGTANLTTAGFTVDVSAATGTAGFNITSTGSTGNTLTGSAKDDILIGGAGNDNLTGGAGNNILDGGLGEDTAIFNANYADYELSNQKPDKAPSYVLVTHKITKETNKLYSFEHIKFADQTVDLKDGTVSDGYVSNALVWIDTNDNGQREWTDSNNNGFWDNGEGESWTLTDSTGKFSDLIGIGNLRITANPNGVTTDISTGDAFTGSYSAVSGSTVINPLTTLIVAAVAAGGTKEQVNTALGLDVSLDLNTYDPLAMALAAGTNTDKALAIKVQSAATQIANVIAVIASVTKADGAIASTITSVAKSVAATLMTSANTSSSKTIDLADSTLLKSVINKALSSVFTDDPTKLEKLSILANTTATAVALVNSKIEISSATASTNAQNGVTVDAISTLKEIVSAQIVAQKTIADQAANVVLNPEATITVNTSNIDAQITNASTDVKQIFVQTTVANLAPTLTAFTSPVATGNEDSKIAVTFANLQLKGDDLDVDGTVPAFVVKTVNTGMLTIGTSAATASAWDATNNNTIDATHQAYWTPDANANGTLNAFTAVAKDNGGLVSTTAIQATVAVAPVNDTPTGAVTITGTAAQNQVLTASNTLADVDGLTPNTITYQWLADGTDITGATTSTLTLTQAQVGKTITVKAAYTDLLGTAESESSAVSSAVANVNDAPTGTVTITGEDSQGQTLTAVNTLADIDGLLTPTYQWLAGGIAIAGATASTLTLTQAQVGKAFMVKAAYTDLLGTAETVSSAAIITGSALKNTLMGTPENDIFYGLAGNDTISGYAGNDILNGGLGADKLIGGAGDDIYFVDKGDVVTEKTGEGTDTVYSSINYILTTNVENLILSGTALIGKGNKLVNTLTGNKEANILDGGIGADSMTGGLGNDTYVVDNASDVVNENAGAGTGTDTVNSSINYTLTDTFTANVENLTLTGTAALNGTGNALNNTLIGNNAANRLDGGIGGDSMSGGLGNDTYVVDVLGDVVIEKKAAGTDTVESLINYTLTDNVEKLTLKGTAALIGTGNTLNNTLSGNDGDNTLDGGSGNDILTGGKGKDTLTGGLGRDTFDFNDISESTKGTTHDSITDFNHSQRDKIDLSGIDANIDTKGNQAFKYIGATAFHGLAGELNYFNDILAGDTNGDKIADFEIALVGNPSLVIADFVL